jgi:hypothetical protein
MKKILFVVLVLSTLLQSCTRQLDTSAVSTSVSSNAATHASFVIAYQVDGVGYYNCPGINEGIYFTGENILKVSYTLRGTVTNVILKGRSKGVTGVGLVTGNHYVVISHSIDKTNADWSEDAKVKTRVKFTLRCVETGARALLTETLFYTIDFRTNEIDITKHEFAYECTP